MKFVFFKNIICENATKCSQNIHEKIEGMYPQLEQGINYHISISHQATNHKIWFFVYEKNYEHEGEFNGELVIEHSEIVRKYNGDSIDINKIKNV